MNNFESVTSPHPNPNTRHGSLSSKVCTSSPIARLEAVTYDLQLMFPLSLRILALQNELPIKFQGYERFDMLKIQRT
jgi:hypothetical protein